MSRTNRIKIQLKNPNHLFVKWLTEWRDEAKAKDSKMQHTFNNALKSLQKYPLPLETGQNCIILKGFGKKLCNMLDNKLQRYNSMPKINNTNEDSDPIINPVKQTNNNNKLQEKNEFKSKTTKSPKKLKPYQPAKGSGGYAILLALLEKSQQENYAGSLSKSEIIQHAKQYSDTSFTKPDSGSFYTAWSSMSTLITKGLVEKKGSPPKFNLTSEGEILAFRLLDTKLSDNETTSIIIEKNKISIGNRCIDYNKMEDLNKASCSTFTIDCNNKINSQPFTLSKNFASSSTFSNSESLSQTFSDAETIIFPSNTFDIILLVDIKETSGVRKNPLEDETLEALNKYKANFEVRHLKVGDFTWICRNRVTNEELVLPYIVERKRMDDLGHSIKDGRFHEQKFRLKQCGIQNLIYIVENYGNNTRTGLPLSSLMQGATNTLIQDQFQVKFTESLQHTMRYLAGFSLTLQHIYSQKSMISCPKENLVKVNVDEDIIPLLTFNDFNKGASKSKSLNVKDTFTKQLLQVKGVSVEKALGIVEKYPTPKLLKMKYDKISATEGEKLLANITFGPLKKSIGPVISKTIYQLYTLDKLS